MTMDLEPYIRKMYEITYRLTSDVVERWRDEIIRLINEEGEAISRDLIAHALLNILDGEFEYGDITYVGFKEAKIEYMGDGFMKVKLYPYYGGGVIELTPIEIGIDLKPVKEDDDD